ITRPSVTELTRTWLSTMLRRAVAKSIMLVPSWRKEEVPAFYTGPDAQTQFTEWQKGFSSPALDAVKSPEILGVNDHCTRAAELLYPARPPRLATIEPETGENGHVAEW